MIIDLVLAGGALLWAILGYMSGALKQIFKLVVIIASYFAAKPVSKMFTGNVESFTGLPREMAEAVSLMLIWFVIALILSIISSIIIRKLFDLGGSELKGIDSIGGLLLSSLKYLAVIYLLIASILSFKMFLSNKFPAFIDKMEESNIVGFIENNNFLNDVETVEFPSRLSKIAILPSVMPKIGQDCYKMHKAKIAPAFCYNLLKLAPKTKDGKINVLDKDFRKILQDPSFKKYIMSKKVGYWIKKAEKERKTGVKLNHKIRKEEK